MSRSPDFVVKLLDKTTEKRGRIGAAWTNEDASISISLDPFVVLPKYPNELVITLFPNEDKTKTRK